MGAINGVNMITDRAKSDVDYVKSIFIKGFNNITEEEKQNFLNGLKGAYNSKDFNRVESAIEYFSQKLVDVPQELQELATSLKVSWNEEFFGVPYDPNGYVDVEVKTDWDVVDILTSADRKRYLDNIVYILQALEKDTTKIPSQLEGMDYNGANEIEKSLVEFDNSLTLLNDEKKSLIIGTTKSWFYSGDLYGGEI